MARSATTTWKRAAGTYGIKSWEEKTWDGKDYRAQRGGKLTHAKVTFTLDGDIEGEGTVQFLMAYRDETYASFVGLQKIVGNLGGREGSFIVQAIGVFENGAAKSTWSVIPGSGTGDLRGLRGEGSTVAVHGDTQPFTLDYYFE